MPTTAEEIVEQARDYSTQFSRHNVPDLAALKAVERLQRQLAEAVVAENPDVLAQWYLVENGLPATWEQGITIPDHLIVLGVEASYDDPTFQRVWEVALLSAGQTMTQPHMYPSAYVAGKLLHLTDVRRWFGDWVTGSHGWEGLVRLRIRYVPAIERLTRLEDPLSLPDASASALVPMLALWMADRVGANLPTLRAQAAAGAEGWVSQMINMASTRSWHVEVVE